MSTTNLQVENHSRSVTVSNGKAKQGTSPISGGSSPDHSVPDLSLLPRLSHPVALRLGRRQATRDIVTAVPLLVADTAMAALAAELAEAVHIAAGGGGHPWFIRGVVLMTLFFQWLHGLYPACGMTYSVEFRRILRTSVCVIAAVTFAMWI